MANKYKDPLWLRENFFGEKENYPKANPYGDIASRVTRQVGQPDLATYTLPGAQGRAGVVRGSGDNVSARQGLFDRIDEDERASQGAFLFEKERGDLGIMKNDLATLERETAGLKEQGYSPANLAGRESTIKSLREEITRGEAGLSTYDSLTKRIEAFRDIEKGKEALAGKRKFELKKEAAKKPFGQTPEGMVIQGGLDIKKELAKNVGKMSEVDKLEATGLQKILGDKLMEAQWPEAKAKLNSILGKYKTGGQPGTDQLRGLIGQKTAKGIIKNVGMKGSQAFVQYEDGTVAPWTEGGAGGQEAPQAITMDQLITQIPARQDRARVIGDIRQALGNKTGPVQYNDMLGLYARASEIRDGELTTIYRNVMNNLPKEGYKEEGKQVSTEIPNGLSEEDVEAVMKEKNYTRQQTINYLMQQQKTLERKAEKGEPIEEDLETYTGKDPSKTFRRDILNPTAVAMGKMTKALKRLREKTRYKGE